jgi:Peptidase of plants and bacteria
MPGQSRRSGRLLVVLTAVVIVVNLSIASGYAAAHHGHGSAARSASATTSSLTPGLGTVRTLLERRSRAVLGHDRSAFLATVDPGEQPFLADQEQLFTNLSELPLADWRETLADPRPVVASDVGWTAHLQMSYRLSGYDQHEVTRTQYLTFTHSAKAGWVISDDGSAHGLYDDPEIWFGGALTVLTGRHTLLLANGGQNTGDLHDIVNLLDAAVSTVSGVVGDQWAQRVVVLVPDSEQQAEALVGAYRNLSDIAAVATVTGGPGGGNTGEDRVVLAPDAFAQLSEVGRRVVLTHELTHVAMGGAVDTRTPIWLIEGLADYVGYKRAGVSTKDAATELSAAIRAGHLPVRLPDRADFAGSGAALSQTYEEAWLACRMVAERYGESTLVKLYRSAGEGQDAAISSLLRLTPAQFVVKWQAYMRAQLS